MNVRVLAEYNCWPLWVRSPGELADNTNPEDLSISKELVQALLVWNEEYQATYDRDVPQDSGFPSPTDYERWLEQGKVLSQRLFDEMGATVELTYEGFDGDVRLNLPAGG